MLLINAHVLCKLIFATAHFKRYLINDLGILQGKPAPYLYVCLGNAIMCTTFIDLDVRKLSFNTSVPDF